MEESKGPRRPGSGGPARNRGGRERPEPAPARTPVRGRRLWLFRGVTILLPPIFFFLLLEAGLRVAGYGYPTDFLMQIPSQDAYTTNPSFGLRFFDKTLARTPQPCRLPAHKPRGTYRIFVLGGSAALGIPKPSYGFSRVLEVMLEETFPGADFEVVNAAMTAINSNVVLPIARDCARYDPDLFIVYLGNNEVIGPYGPGTIFAGFSRSVGLIRAAVWLRTTRTGQLLTDLARRLGRKKAPRAWGGMEMFLHNPIPADDPRLPGVYDHLRANLTDICRAAEKSNAATILCTVGTNLRDCPPFASVHRRGLSPAGLDRWQDLYDRGRALESSGDLASAAEAYGRAAQIDPGFADLQFRLARCLWGSGRFSESAQHYRLAREQDALRFRADDAINRTIRDVGTAEGARGVHLVDAESAFRDSALHGVPGRDLFYEHVHMNWAGTCVLAETVFRQVVPLLPGEIRRRAGPAPSPPSTSRCAELLALTEQDRFGIADQMNAMMNNPPFTNQIDQERARAIRKAELEGLKAALTPEVLRQDYEIHAQAVARKPGDLCFREAAAELAYDSGNYAEAAQQYRKLLDLCPGVPAWRLELGRSLGDIGKASESEAIFRSLLHNPLAAVEARNGLGVALDREGRTEEAVEQYRQAVRYDPRATRPRYNLGVVLARQGKAEEALQEYSQVLDADSSFVDAYLGIGDVLEHQGKPDAAIEQYRRALRVDPLALDAGKRLGVALARQGRFEEAIEQFTNVVRVNPRAADAYANLGSALAQVGRNEEAMAAYRSALEADPNLPSAHYGLGAVLAQTGRDDAAAAGHLRTAIRLSQDWMALGRLADLLTTSRDPRVRNPVEAIDLAQKACALTRGADPILLRTLAGACAAVGRFDSAAIACDMARKVAERRGDSALAKDLERTLALYRQKSSGTR